MQGGTELNTNIKWQFNFLVMVLFSCLCTFVQIPFMVVKSLRGRSKLPRCAAGTVIKMLYIYSGHGTRSTHLRPSLP